MSVLLFAEDFSQLVMRYMKHLPLNNNKSKNVIIPLTNDQITFTVHHVLRALGVENNANDKDNDNDFVTNFTNNEIKVIPTEAPFLKINGIEDNENGYRSEAESPFALTDCGSSLSDTSLKETENSLNSLQKEKKFISRSNPAICVSVGRSDTFVCKEESKTNNDISEDASEDSLCSPLNDQFRESLDEIGKFVINIKIKLDDLKKKTFQQSIQRPQQLPSNSLLNFNRTSTMITKDSNIDKSMTTFSTTPTFSKLHTKENTLGNRRKSIGGIVNNITPKKLELKKMDESTSTLNRSVIHNKTTSGLVPKLTKNPKYAHVKSTIPKPITLIKKKQ